MKYVTSDHFLDPTTHANLGFQDSSGGKMGAWPHSDEIVTRVDFTEIMTRGF